MEYLSIVLKDRRFLFLLLIINILGTVYGYYWYGNQLAHTPAIFLPFVPDSPTASLFFVFVLVGFLLNRNFKLFEALALITLFKYGVWAVVMNLLTYGVTGFFNGAMLMLVLSHSGMALQGLLYVKEYRFKMIHLVIAGIWTLHNEIIDYVFGMMPTYSMLNDYMTEIGYFTFWLSIISILLAYFLVLHKDASHTKKV